jgi:hypothetical protein
MAAAYFPSSSDRETARLLLDALEIYTAGRWRRDAALERCPPQYAGTHRLLFWAMLRLHAHVPFNRVVRAAVARSRQ